MVFVNRSSAIKKNGAHEDAVLETMAATVIATEVSYHFLLPITTVKLRLFALTGGTGLISTESAVVRLEAVVNFTSAQLGRFRRAKLASGWASWDGTSTPR